MIMLLVLIFIFIVVITFLLLNSYKTSVKHYRVTWDGKQLCFGLGRFNTLNEFLDHFRSRPIISGESGIFPLYVGVCSICMVVGVSLITFYITH